MSLVIVGYDTETWSGNQISKGLEHYFSDPEFAIICAAWAPEHSSSFYSTNEVVPGDGPPYLHCAHNMPFDRQAVLMHGISQSERILWFDTMVGVRAILGASLGRNTYVSLDKSSKLLLPEEFHKDPNGANYMPWFSFPSPQNRFGKLSWKQMVQAHPEEWRAYLNYCEQDAVVAKELALLAREYLGIEAFERLVYEAELTYRMNRAGWPVDTHLLQVMTDKAQENTEQSIDNLIAEYNPGWSTVKKNGDELFKPLNLNSAVQLKKWLLERDIQVPNTQSDTIDETIAMVEDNLDIRPDWEEVLAVLQAKVDRGGATLKKLEPIRAGLSPDGRLRDMYNHIAAAATHRTTGSKAQMQNLKRLPDEVEDLTEASIALMNNGELAKNIRQLFKAQHPEGQIIVADLKSIEGLLVGWVFGVEWMVQAVRDGKDMYKMSASERFKVLYDSVLPQQRRTAKTGVLAGNYGGGWKAYMKQSPGMTKEEAQADVKAYRSTVPNLVQGWWNLNDMLIEAVEEGGSGLHLHNGYSVTAGRIIGLLENTGEYSLEITMHFKGKEIFSRLWHGVRIELDEDDRKEVTYAVADERKTAAQPWKRETSEGERYKLYGGKLTGTLIQSLARELYFYQLTELSKFEHGSLQFIGQLHDEVVAEWMPDGLSLERAEAVIESAMSQVPWYLENCPVRVKVSHAPRYIK